MQRIKFYLLAILGCLAVGLLGALALESTAATAALPLDTDAKPGLAASQVCGPCASTLPAWQVASPMPTPAVAAPAVASDGTYAYVVGGYSYQSAAPTNRVARFQPPNGAWQPLATSPDAHSESLAVYAPSNNRIYVFGGVTSTGTVLATTRVYDIATNSWSIGPAMPGPRRQMGGGYLTAGICVAGGYSGPTVSSVQSTVYCYNPASNVWSTAAPLPQPVGGPGYGVIANRLYIAGGRDATNPNLNTLFEYDPAINAWNVKANLCQGVNTPGSAVVNNRLWVFGGGNPLQGAQPHGSFAAPQTTNLLQVYDPPINDWTTPNTPLNVARSLIGGTNVGNIAVAVGGYDGTTSVVTIEVNSGGSGAICGLTPTPNPATPTMPTPTMPAPMTSTPTRTAYPPSAPTKTPTPTPTGTPPTPLPTPASCYTYWVTTGTGAIVPAATLVPGSNCDDCVVSLDLSALNFQFPFYDLFGPAYATNSRPDGPPIMGNVLLDSNGRAKLGARGTATPSPTNTALAGKSDMGGVGPPKAPGINVCLPSPDHVYTIFPHWDDLRTDCTGCGIFTSITGTVGSRIFDIEWRAEYYLCGGRVNFELRLHETTGEIEIIYGQVDQSGSLTTVGVQRDMGLFTQYTCNTLGSLTPGRRLRFMPQSCSAPTVTATATVTGTPPTPTRTLTPVVVCLIPSATATVTATATSTATSTTATATSTPCRIQFTDVPQGRHTFYAEIRCLACRGIVSGYADGTFRPDNMITRGQLSKIISNAAGINDDPNPQVFQDVPPDNPFYIWINRLTRRDIMGGYLCGGPGEPCVNNRPYFRPNNNATRGQISKIVSNTAGFYDRAREQIFEDVPPGSTFYDFIQRLASRGIMGGYNCGGLGEPCLEPNHRPYFRPNNNATRGQTSKIVSNTFFPGCSTPNRPDHFLKVYLDTRLVRF